MRYILLLGLVLVGFVARAQDFVFDAAKYRNTDLVALKLPLLSPLDITGPSINLGVEFAINPKLGLHQEVGFISKYSGPLYLWMEADVEQMYGFKYRADLRFYIDNRAEFLNFFIAPTLRFRWQTQRMTDDVRRFGGSYREELTFDLRRIQTAALFTVGFHSMPGNKAGIKLEPTFSVGAVVWHFNGYPADAERVGAFLFMPEFRRPQTRIRPYVMVGVALQFPLKKRQAVLEE